MLHISLFRDKNVNFNQQNKVFIKVRRCSYASSDVNIVMMMFFEIFTAKR